MYDIIIIGGGPAGLTAAIYARRANKKVLLIEKNMIGGQIVNASNVENYPGVLGAKGFELATTMYNQASNLGTEIKMEQVLRVEEDKTVITDKNTYKAQSIIIATGSSNKKLNITGEEELIGKGVSYCATCDGNFFKEKDVCVIGGGNTALEDAIYLSGIVNKVYLIHRRDEFRADQKLVEEAKEKNNIEFILNNEVERINGITSVESITLKDNTNINLSGVFIAVGQTPKNEIFKNILELDKDGYIITKDNVKTNINGIYVAGDCRVKDLRQLTTAVADASLAATYAIKDVK